LLHCAHLFLHFVHANEPKNWLKASIYILDSFYLAVHSILWFNIVFLLSTSVRSTVGGGCLIDISFINYCSVRNATIFARI
jgi:hypothetical protein